MSKEHVYDNYEISGCHCLDEEEENGRQSVEVCGDDEAQFWTLYGHINGQGVEAIADFPSRRFAEQVFYRITGQPFTGSYRADARLRLMHAAPALLEALNSLAGQADEDCPGECRSRHFVAAMEEARAAIAEATGEAGPQPAMQEYHLDGKRCPHCNNAGPFQLEVTGKVTVRQDGTLDIADGEWGLDIDCDCPKCGFAGRLEDFCEWVELSGQKREGAVKALRMALSPAEATAALEPSDDHTPGPWQQSWQFIVAPDPGGIHPDIYLAEIAEEDSEGRVASPEQQEANGRLIVAGPELLAACRMVVARWEHGDLAEAARACQAAITLATDGRPPWNVTDAASAGSKRYAVLLRYPDHANDSGAETYYAFVTASDPLTAVTLAQRQAAKAQEGIEIEPDDFVPLLVTPGHPVSEPLFNK